jgi:pyrroloquinoline-quinone synthase
MESRRQWSRRLRRLADDAGVLTHPFFDRIAAQSDERRKLLLDWAEQDYFVSRRFPCLLGAVIAEIDDPAIRHPMVENLWEEHGEGTRGKTHYALYCDLLESMGLPRDLDQSVANDETRTFIEIQERIARQNVLLGLGAFCYANEYLTVPEFAPLQDAVSNEFPQADLRFFVANREVDGRHAKQTEDVIELLITSDSELSEIENGATAALEKRVAFYDAILENRI